MRISIISALLLLSASPAFASDQAFSTLQLPQIENSQSSALSNEDAFNHATLPTYGQVLGWWSGRLEAFGRVTNALLVVREVGNQHQILVLHSNAPEPDYFDHPSPDLIQEIQQHLDGGPFAPSTEADGSLVGTYDRTEYSVRINAEGTPVFRLYTRGSPISSGIGFGLAVVKVHP